MTLCFFFFFNDTATTEIYTLSLHDALPISSSGSTTNPLTPSSTSSRAAPTAVVVTIGRDRKSTRLNSSHSQISYAVFCLKKKKASRTQPIPYHIFSQHHHHLIRLNDVHIHR